MKHVRYNANEQHNLCISSLPINSLLGVFHANALQSMCGYRRGQSLPNNSNSHSLINNWISREKKIKKSCNAPRGGARRNRHKQITTSALYAHTKRVKLNIIA